MLGIPILMTCDFWWRTDITYRPNTKCARALVPDCGFTISGTKLDSDIHNESEIVLQLFEQQDDWRI